MNGVSRAPWVGFLSAAAVIGGFLAMTGRLDPVFEEDSRTYLTFDFHSPRAMLGQIRTVGYPLFLAMAGDTDRVPWLQFGIHVMAVAVFLGGLRAAGYSNRTAAWCSVTLLLGRGAVDLARLVTADSLAVSLAIASTGCLVAVTAGPSRRSWWIGLVVCTFLAYQVRPAYLFLIVTWPVVAWVLDVFLLRRGAPRRARWSRVGRIALATIGPFFVFCGVRWAVVGHFGLVSFGGHNLIGIAGQFLDRELVDTLPDDVRPLARAMLRSRVELGHAPAGDFAGMEAMYNPTAWQVAAPSAASVYGEDVVAANRGLSRLALAVLRRRPAAYARWLVGNANHARRQLLTLIVFDKGTGALLIVFLAGMAVSLVANRSVRRTDAGIPATRAPRDVGRLETHLLFWTALLFAAAKTSLVLLVEPANDRYMTGAAVLIPAAIAAAAAGRTRTDEGRT
ncbi:MAG: hypothetical protein FJ297_10760 [Planctomycetes bacterium]|nr:hypothetical protein [Planctomycetota bacterium]